ncbi:GNAT family N-acetyltransferase [Kiloniella laminariae]|uniref:GNAT family N-acetyltransferase n=1 Tax=Kiloniella laminariae TaxID=454162 RepID=A0ABT4LND1_9PROT|nr:GNAT family N-acetyltransferase [Kiloniella laminariae]MCZ4282655.1 GNAT family N-acetyltransferase [Kiloniella laminariae]
MPPKKITPGSTADGFLDVTITYLEMHTRPQQLMLNSPHNNKTSLLKACKPTTSFYRYLYNTVGSPWLWWERRVMSDEELKRIITDEAVEIYVLYFEGVPAGYAELDRRKEPVIELAYMGLIPEFTGCKLGPYLLSAVIDIAWSYAPEKLIVNTCTLDHPKALGLYQRCGFTPVEQKTKSISDPRLISLPSFQPGTDG